MAIPQFVLGSFNLTDWAGVAYGTSVIAQGTSKGAPVPLEVAIQSWLQDGSVVVTQGYDNRTMSLRVKLRGPSLTAVAQAEAALFAELGKPNTLTWTHASGPATVFNVVTSSMEHSPSTDEDIVEAMAYPWRTFDLRLVCEAFTRSAAEIIATAFPASGTTTTTVNNGSATTGWTGAVSAGTLSGPTVVSGAVKVGTSAAVTGVVNVTQTLTASISTSATPHLVIDWKPESTGGRPDFRVYGDGTLLPLMAQYASPTAGFTRSWYSVAASSIAVLRLESRSDVKSTDPALVRSIYVDNINRTDVQPSFGTGRQVMRVVPVSGSARTQGSLMVEHATNALGDVIAYTFPDDDTFDAYTPSMRQYRVAGGGTVTTDATTVSGAWDDIKTVVSTFDVPVANLLDGLHTLVARLSNGSAVNTLVWTAATLLNGTQLGATATGTVTLPITGSATSYVNLPLGRVVLPNVDLGEAVTNAVVRLTVTVTTTLGTAPRLDEVWLFSDVGQLMMVSCGTGTAASGGPARRLWVQPATVTRPRPTLLVGHAADQTDSYFPIGAVASWQSPQFVPPRARVFVVTSNASEPSVTLKHFPRWHTHAAS